MIRKLKRMSLQMIAGANIATIIIMFILGNCDYFNPSVHPYLACGGMLYPLFLIFNLLFLVFWLLFHIRGVWIPILGYIIGFASLRVYLPINVTFDVPSEGSIKILSYNVMAYGGEYDGTYPIIEYIRNSKADIVCLQEDIGEGKLRDKVNDRLSEYKYRDTTRIGISNCIGLYSKYPILSKERIEHVSKTNGSVAYRLKMGNDTVLLINNHLENCHLSQDDRTSYRKLLRCQMEKDTASIESKKLIERLAISGSVRSRQIREIVNYIEKNKGESIILCGDFNDNPISYSRRMIAKELTDCYVKTGTGIGLSYNRKGFFVRIDNIMCSSDWTPYGCKIDNKIKESDHYPIYCWLKKHSKH